MSQHTYVSLETASDAADLVDDYRRRRVALQQEARELARLQTHVLGAAERDAAAIVAGTRDRIGRVLVEARRDLQNLSRRVEAIAGIDSDDDRGVLDDHASIRDAAAAWQSSLQQARREVARVLDDAKPELEQLQTQESTLVAIAANEGPAAFRALVEPLVRHPPDPTPPDEFEARVAPPERPLLSTLPSAFGAVLQRDSIRVWLIAFAIAAFATLLGAVLVMRQSSPRPISASPDSRSQGPQRSRANDAGGKSSEPTAPVLQPRASATGVEPPIVAPRAAVSGDAKAGTKPRLELTAASQRWLAAYGREDVTAMRLIASPSLRISDQRADNERLPRAAENVRMSLQNVSLQLVGDTSILTARMIEQGTAGGQDNQRISRVSLIWIRENGQWQVTEVEILGDPKLRSQ